MKSEKHLEIYRVAFESANSELTEITAEVEKLRIRKEQIERLITVLTPLFDDEKTLAVAETQSQSQEQGETTAENPVDENAQLEPVMADPFQRRIDHVLGIGAGIRDVRKYSRQF
jgi:hypothetical protein